MIQEIIQLTECPDILRRECRALSKAEIKSDEIQLLIESMKECMRRAPGVGLAAPQIGLNIQLAVIEDSAENLKNIPENILKSRERNPVDFHVIINPVIVEKKGEIRYCFEGCLSVKGKVRITPRHQQVIVHCLDEQGNKREIDARGWYARILQHEIDHLNGRLYIDISDEKTEMTADEHFKKSWMYADDEKIMDLYLSV